MDALTVFVSYSRKDGFELANILRSRMTSLPMPVAPWIDVDQAGGYSTEELLEAGIGSSDVLMFIATEDSVRADYCLGELDRARTLRKRILLVRTNQHVEFPIQVRARANFADFTASLDTGWRQLEDQLTLYSSPAAMIKLLEEQEAYWLARVGVAGKLGERARTELAELTRRIRAEYVRLNDPQAAEATVARIVTADMRSASSQKDIPPAARLPVVGPLPQFAPNQFWDRLADRRAILSWLVSHRNPVAEFRGSHGTGKSALISTLLDEMQLSAEDPVIDGAVYVSAHGYRPITPAGLIEDLANLMTAVGQRTTLVEWHIAGRGYSWTEKMEKIARGLAGRRVLIVIDNAEELLDELGEFHDFTLREFVEHLARSQHGIKVLLISTQPLAPSNFERPKLVLDAELPLEDSRRLIRELDPGGIYGLRDAPTDSLDGLLQALGGNPRTIELASTLLRTNPFWTAESLRAFLTAGPPPVDIGATLLAEVLDSLDRIDRRVVEALAIYGRPVRTSAIDHLLQTLLPGREGAEILQSLADRRLIRRDDAYYFLPPTDAEHVRRRIPPAVGSDLDDISNRASRQVMFRTAAEYFAQRQPSVVHGISDLRDAFSLIDLRVAAGQYEIALTTMHDLEQEHLQRLGALSATLRWRRVIQPKAGNARLEMHNLSAMANICGEQDELDRKVDYLHQAVEISHKLSDPWARTRLLVQLGDAHYYSLRVTSARRCYRSAYVRAFLYKMPREARQARLGMSLCDVETGRSEHALRTLTNLRSRSTPEGDRSRELFEGDLEFDIAIAAAEFGETEHADAILQAAAGAAAQSGQTVLEGACIEAQVRLAIDRDDLPAAIQLAGRCVKIGEQTQDGELRRDANASLALAYLFRGDVLNAKIASDAAARNKRTRSALACLAIQGIIAFRLDDAENASSLFLRLGEHARVLLRGEKRSFRLHDLAGLAMTGLYLTTPEDYRDRAIVHYRSARRMTKDVGTVRRAAQLFDQLDVTRMPELGEIRRSLNGIG